MTLNILAPQAEAPAVRAGDKLTYWKQILPERSIDYTDETGATRTLNFDRTYIDDCVSAFKQRAIDQVCVQLANSDNSHGRDFDPEKQRGQVLEMAHWDDLPAEAKQGVDPVKGRGLWGKVQFWSKSAAKAVRQNPELGVSPRIREEWTRSDGRQFKRAVVHVLATIDPRNPGLSPWRTASLSCYPDANEATLDLSQRTYTEGTKVAKNKGKGKGGSALAELTDEQFEALAAELGFDLDEIAAAAREDEHPNDPDEDPDPNEKDPDEQGEDGSEGGSSIPARQPIPTENGKLVGAGTTSLSNPQGAIVDLSARQAADEALRQLADQAWQTERASYVGAGVPAYVLDLAAPYLSRPHGFTVDLSNDGTATQDVAGDFRKVLDAFKGTVDLSGELGHGATAAVTPGDNDPDKALLDQWNQQYPGF